ncbi:MAG: GNAT family N-acetyltransferase [Candidatus Heimdallarchaeaceae archaeon]
MSREHNQIDMKLVKRFQWRAFKKMFLQMFADDPELYEAPRIKRYFLFKKVRKNAENYYCYLNKKRAGLLSLRTNRATEAFIYGIAVLPKYRRRGLGKFMMEFSEKRANETNKKFMSLAVLCNNEPAVNLYKEYGYKTLGEGVSFLSISVDKILKTEKNTLKLEQVKMYNEELKKFFSDIILQQIESVSGNDGIEYIKENRLDGYHTQIIRYINRGRFPLHRILSEENKTLGFIFYRLAKETLICSLYLHVDICKTDFLSKLAEKIKLEINPRSNIKRFKLRVPLHVANKLLDLNKTSFIRDSSLDKFLMFKKIR